MYNISNASGKKSSNVQFKWRYHQATYEQNHDKLPTYTKKRNLKNSSHEVPSPATSSVQASLVMRLIMPKGSPESARSGVFQWHPAITNNQNRWWIDVKILGYNNNNVNGKCTFSCCIWDFNWLPSLLVTEQAITGLVTPQARPRACLEGTKTYGTFCKATIIYQKIIILWRNL